MPSTPSVTPTVPVTPTAPVTPTPSNPLPANGLDGSLTHGHDIECDDHCALPCNWVDYYERPAATMFTNETDDPTSFGDNFPVDGIAETADSVFAVVDLVKKATSAKTKLDALGKVLIPNDGAITSVRLEHVTTDAAGKTVMKADSFSDNRVAAALASKPLAQVRSLQQVQQRYLEQTREESIWKIVEQVLLGLVAGTGALGTILTIAGVAAAGPVAWAVVGIGTALALCKAIHTVRNKHRAPVLTETDEKRLGALQEAIRAECMDHTSVGHKVVALQVKGETEAQTVTHMASDILNAGQKAQGQVWFDSAREFADADIGEYFSVQ